MGQEKEYDILLDRGMRTSQELDEVIMDGLSRYRANPNDEFLRKLIPFLADVKMSVLRQNIDIIELTASKEDEDIMMESAQRSLANAQSEAYQISDEMASLVASQKASDDYTPSL